MPRKILVLFAHPALERSRVHRRLLAAPQQTDGVTLRDLYELYPRFDISVRDEQQALEQHDVIVFQHPLYWYSTPPILKQWQDLVLEHGWAYGHRGKQLEGKFATHVVTCGGGKDAYREQGLNRFSVEDFLRPHEQTARLCSMRWLPPLITFGTHAIEDEGIDASTQAYRERLVALRDSPSPGGPS